MSASRSIGQETLDRARALLDAPAANASEGIRALLQDLFGWPYKIAPGAIRDDAQTSEPFEAVIHVPGAEPQTPIRSDNAAAAIVIVDTLDIATFEAGYRRIAHAKALAKSPAPVVGGEPVSTVTLGAIVARSCAVPLDAIADALDRLNRETHHEQWTDIVTVLAVGVINYGIQFPTEGVTGDFLPPARDAGKTNLPPCYVVITIRPVGAYAFNKLAAFLTAHLRFFSPSAKLPDFKSLLEGMSDTGITKDGFQFNLAGDLVAVPREHYNDRYIAPQPLQIQDRKGKPLAAIQRLAWQDGAVLLLHGKIPLDGMLIFCPFVGKPRLTVFRRDDDIQLSTVLPLSPAQFVEGLQRFQRQSNMVVKPPTGHWVYQKISDEGTTTPFVARILLGLLRLRDVVYADAKARDRFDKLFEQMTSALGSAREAAATIDKLWTDHIAKITSGAIVTRNGNVLHIAESIDKELRQETEAFLNSSIRALKHGLQQVADELGVKLGFWFQKPHSFANGVAALQTTDAALAAYLDAARSEWSETLVVQRNAIEHDGWTMPKIAYRDEAGAVTADEPLVGSVPVRTFTNEMLDHLCSAIEDVAAHLLRWRFPDVIGLHEVPLASRPQEAPERFRITSLTGGEPLWALAYPTTRFEAH